MIKVLPLWRVTDKFPAFYDSESGTCIEMTAKVYAAVRELQEDYNSMITEINKKIEEYESGTNKSFSDFKAEIIKIVHDYFAMLDTKIKLQDLEIDNQNKLIDDTIVYIKNNLTTSIREIVEEMKTNDEFNEVVLQVLEDLTNTNLTYKENDESLLLYNPLRPAVDYDGTNEEVIIINLPEESEV